MSVRVVHHSKGYAALLKHPRLQADLERRARAIAEAADAASTWRPVVAESSDPIRRRNRAAVIAPMGDPHNLILRNMDSGR